MTTNRCCGIGLLGGQSLSMGLRGRIQKYLLKKLLQRYLPPEMVYRPKQGFGLPLGRGLPTRASRGIPGHARTGPRPIGGCLLPDARASATAWAVYEIG